MLIYFCSPFRGPDQGENERFAEQACREIALSGATPFAPHLFLTRFLDDHNHMERQRGIDAGLEIMALADEVWLRIPPWRLSHSEGMKYETLAAGRFGKRIVYINTAADWTTALARVAAHAPKP